MVAKTTATAIQKENFKLRFAEIVKNNSSLKDKYTIQFFETAQKSNYVFYGLNGKTINILLTLSLEEAEKYKTLKFDWQN
ncbi:hypothetical protein [Mucilaginibacter gotjawali]|uniref:Uncharacterized protein n=2 Tax=Mucilaginibacter gotjawali TaxID=1550579 RepID=A0A839SIJ4_9SPHI|nr:hypothetical protein [Mucilaginibacter gotjawali]MBB3056337.1 hypothetical protein [Mucilaginibacter gotjawali]BAU55041.1 hypothetical protein MgSA37_03222 [Mucilaginibacter gotjawali]